MIDSHAIGPRPTIRPPSPPLSRSLIPLFAHSLVLSFPRSLVLSFSRSLVLSFSRSLVLQHLLRVNGEMKVYPSGGLNGFSVALQRRAERLEARSARSVSKLGSTWRTRTNAFFFYLFSTR